MKKMKPFAIILVCLLFVYGLAACSGGSNTPANNKEATPPSSNQPAPETAEEEPKEEAIDLGGRTIKLSAWWDLTPKGETASEKARLDKIAELEKKYNMKIEFVNVPWGEYVDTFTTSVLAGEPFADIVRMEVKWALPAILNGLLLPLDEFTSASSDINTENNYVEKIAPVAGGEYGFKPIDVGGVGLHYNRDIFKQYGLPDLHELYNRGELTWDKLLEIARDATRDTNGDGKPDVWGWSGWAAHVSRNMVAANGARIANDSTGEQGLTDPKTIEALEFVHKLYNVENVVYLKSGNKMEWTEWDSFKDGKSAMWIAAEWQVGDIPFDFGVVPIPNGPGGSKDFTYNNGGGHAYFIPKGVKDAEILYHIFEEMEMIPPFEDYVGQDYLEQRYKHQEDIDVFLSNINGTGVLEMEEAYPDFPFYPVIDEVILQNASVTATVEKFKQQAQEAMDKLKQ
ncbi:ABC transporter substrate-binding protein [Paenibacillus tarimensis]